MTTLQGTIATFDEQHHNGSLLLDDGTSLPYPATAFEASGLRLLRLGQRVRIERDEAGEISLITLPTL